MAGRFWLLAASIATYVLLTLGLPRSVHRDAKSCACGIITTAPRVVGSAEGKPNKYPWMVAIRVHKELECGGSLINDRYVLTAAHCVHDRFLDDMDVVLGAHNEFHMDSNVMTRNVLKTIIHEQYEVRPTHDSHDVALVLLDEVVEFSWKVTPVCLPSISIGERGEKGIYKHGRHHLHVASWGRVSDKGKYGAVLMEGKVRTMPTEACVNRTKYTLAEIDDDNFCAAADSTGTCTGDSGGPLTVQVIRSPITVEQIGIVSWGVGCADPEYPGVYTNVTQYLAWILNNTADAKYCKY